MVIDLEDVGYGVFKILVIFSNQIYFNNQHL